MVKREKCADWYYGTTKNSSKDATQGSKWERKHDILIQGNHQEMWQ